MFSFYLYSSLFIAVIWESNPSVFGPVELTLHFPTPELMTDSDILIMVFFPVRRCNLRMLLTMGLLGGPANDGRNQEDKTTYDIPW